MTRERPKTMQIRMSLFLVLILAAFSSGAFLARTTGFVSQVYENGGEEFSLNGEGEFRFIHPRPVPGKAQPAELKPFRYKISSLIEKRLKAGDAAAVSVYFRELNGGHHFGIHEEDVLSSEGLLKLPVMTAYLKWAESDPLILKRKLQYSGTAAARSEEGSYQPLRNGRSYSIDDLLIRMIVYDDSDAHALLSANLPPAYLDRVFKDVYVNYDPEKKNRPVPLSAYASFFRTLYHASYLNKEMSEKALRYLSRSAFRNKIAAGIPSNVDCAMKFGERAIDPDAAGPVRQMHAFGIVYQPNRPYLMGVIAKGDDPEKLASLLQDITTAIYNEVDRQSR